MRSARSLPFLIPAVFAASTSTSRTVPSQGFADPTSWLTNVPESDGAHEPVNVVLSGASDPDVLNNQLETGGLVTYFQSFGFSYECLGQHDAVHQAVDLGDGNGYTNETNVMRWDYGDITLGTCKETVNGGNHFRYWLQNGKQANTGAVFIAASYEMPISQGHNIAENGYNLGRDWIIGNATAQSSPIPTLNLTGGVSYTGQTTASGFVYQTSVQYVSGKLQNSSDGINHASDVEVNGLPAVDGLVAVMTANILQKPAQSGTMAMKTWPTTSLAGLFCTTLLYLAIPPL